MDITCCSHVSNNVSGVCVCGDTTVHSANFPSLFSNFVWWLELRYTLAWMECGINILYWTIMGSICNNHLLQCRILISVGSDSVVLFWVLQLWSLLSEHCAEDLLNWMQGRSLNFPSALTKDITPQQVCAARMRTHVLQSYGLELHCYFIIFLF